MSMVISSQAQKEMSKYILSAHGGIDALYQLAVLSYAYQDYDDCPTKHAVEQIIERKEWVLAVSPQTLA
jgi:hypothetical protein